MCGRYALTLFALKLLDEKLQTNAPIQAVARYNISPSQPVAAFRTDRDSKLRELTFLKWGLVPFWAKDITIGNRMINARAETVAEKPSFRGPFRYKRCLIPADGYYEWRKLPTGGKQPYFIQLKTKEPFTMAGLWESWTSPDGSELQTCAIITTSANVALSDIHDRMPVIVRPDEWNKWLDPEVSATDALLQLLKPLPPEETDFYPVSTLVNNPDNDAPRCLEPLDLV